MRTSGQWQLLSRAWTNYTPGLSNITLGNGSISGRYCVIGGAVKGRLVLNLGSTTVINGGPSLGLPVTRGSNLNDTAVTPIGTVYMLDASGGSNTRTGGIAIFAGNTTATVIADRVGNHTNPSTFSPNIPWTWAAGDILAISFEYEID